MRKTAGIRPHSSGGAGFVAAFSLAVLIRKRRPSPMPNTRPSGMSLLLEAQRIDHMRSCQPLCLSDLMRAGAHQAKEHNRQLITEIGWHGLTSKSIKEGRQRRWQLAGRAPIAACRWQHGR
jgi:hypothetical protein